MTKTSGLAAGVAGAAIATIMIFAATAPALTQDRKATAEEKAAVLAQETPEEKLERETRRQCAIAACSTLRTKKPDTGPLACSVRKTWRKEVLNKIMSKGKVSWPWGNARCTGELKIDRALLVQAISGPEFEAKFDKHELQCELDLEKNNEKYTVRVQLTPKVTFKDGKAIKASMNWGEIDAPTLAKAGLWTITAADNQLGVFQSMIVDDINEFIDAKCNDVKAEWEGK